VLAAVNAGAGAGRKPLRVIVPSRRLPPTSSRAVFSIAPQLGRHRRGNRPGAGGIVQLRRKGSPDASTILAHGSTHTLRRLLNLSYDPERDFAAVVPFGISPVVLVVSPAKGFKTVGDFVATAKAKPGTFNFSSVGIGTATHMSAERFRFSAGVDAAHVPFKGGAEAMLEVMAERVDFFFGPVGLVLPHVREGKLSALVVNSSKRSAALPDLPTTQEAGYANAEYPIWFGLFLPAKTPRDIVDKLHAETTKALQSPKLREKLAALGIEPMAMTPQEFDALVQKEVAINATLVKTIGLKPE
jgi:tripartite-type tricarboxylate transporter receptor subunit TctC